MAESELVKHFQLTSHIVSSSYNHSCGKGGLDCISRVLCWVLFAKTRDYSLIVYIHEVLIVTSRGPQSQNTRGDLGWLCGLVSHHQWLAKINRVFLAPN